MSKSERNLLAQALVEDVLEYGRTVYLVEHNQAKYYCSTEEKAIELINKISIKLYLKSLLKYKITPLDLSNIIDDADEDPYDNFSKKIHVHFTGGTFVFKLTKITVDAN